MSSRIHHINFLVRDLEAALPAWERLLGRPADARDRLEARGVLIARFRLGDAWLALVQPYRPGTAPARHLEEHGEGFFLLSLAVDDLDAEIRRLGDSAFDGPERQGAQGWRIRDLDAAALGGVLLQFAED